MRRSYFLWAVAFWLFLGSFSKESAKRLAGNYVDRYKEIAMEEMKRSGIPASIKLAQGMLESDLGRSPLAIDANNHFGIKCGKNWAGGTFFKHDDDTDKDGNVIQSCFRTFANPEESYVAHSEFLTNPIKQSRYGFLFQLPATDYKSWAQGLKSAGYATDPAYPAKLIKLIEEHELFVYDSIIAKSKGEYPLTTTQHTEKKTEPALKKYIVTTINGLKAIQAAGGESIEFIALCTGLDVHELIEYNEGLETPRSILAPEEFIFLERKKKCPSDTLLTFHLASGGENLFQISQKYGIRLQCLVDRNGIPENCTPFQGEKVSLIKILSGAQKPKCR